jgi:hypothetical protein
MKQLLVITFLLAATTAMHAQEKTVNKNFKNIRIIRLNTSSGDVILRKSNSTDVDLNLRYSYDEDEFKPTIDESNGTLTIKEEFSRGNHSGSSSWELTVPNDARVNLNTGSGNLTMDGVNAEVKTNLGSGDIELTSVKGKLDFNTGSGNIELTDTNGDVSLNTGSGNIQASKSSGDFSFNAGSGNIRLKEIKGDLSMNTGSGDINATSIIINGSSKFNTGSGNATVSLAGDLDHDISVNSGSGDATLDFNGSPISGEVIMTANERNGNIVAPFKFDKEETIKENNSSARIQKTAKLGNKDITIKVGTGTGTATITK